MWGVVDPDPQQSPDPGAAKTAPSQIGATASRATGTLWDPARDGRARLRTRPLAVRDVNGTVPLSTAYTRVYHRS